MISVIIPTRNEEKYLPRLFESLKNQTYKDFEVIVADASSTDGTVKIAQDFAAQVVTGGMPAVGRNNGAKVARGETFLFLDADVLLAPDFLEKAVKELDERSADFGTPFMEPINHDLANKISHAIGNFPYYFSVTTPGFCILIRAELFKKVGGFDESVKVMEDLKFGQEAAKLGKFVVLKSVKILVSDRRMKRDGWFITSIRTVLIVTYVKLFGFPKHNLFGYQFKDYQ